jgi:hypothetical protein
MPKDRDQLTPAEPSDQGRLGPQRSADKEARRPDDHSSGPGPASHGSDPAAVDEVGGDESSAYEG